MKNFPYVFLAIFLLLTPSLQSQNCPNSGVTLSSQKEVDDFVNTYSDCSRIIGVLEITGDDVTDLSGLSSLTKVTHGIKIHDSESLSNLKGLQNISFLKGGILLLENLESLKTLSGLNGTNLELVTDLIIRNNKSLTDISALLGIHTIQSALEISNNDSLTSLEGLNWVQKISNHSRVTENKSLIDCGAICNLIKNNTVIINVDNPLTSCQNILQVMEACAGPTCEEQEINALFYSSQVGDILYIRDYSYGHITGRELTINIPGYTPEFGRNELILPTGTHTLCLTVTNDCGGKHTYCEEVSVPISSYGCQVHASLYLDSQEAVDRFGIEHVNCPNYIGQLVISGADIKNLSGLNSLEKLNSDLIIGNCDSLKTLKGLENLTYVRGGLYIQHNAQLRDISSLHNLDSIRYLSIENNNELFSLNGLHNIKKIHRLLTIRNNKVLTDCSAACPILENVLHSKSIDNPLDNCKSAYNISQVYGCEFSYSRSLKDEDQDGFLSDVDPNDLNPCIPYNKNVGCYCPNGDVVLNSQKAVDLYAKLFSNCNTVEGNLIISGADITSIDKLQFVTTINGDLLIEECPLLMSINGLQNIHTINGVLKIFNMNNLTTLTWLNGENIGSVGGNVVIRHNEKLTNISSLLGLHTINGHLLIGWNDLLNDLTGINQLEYVTRKVIINDNGSLRNCKAVCYLLNEGEVNNGFVFEDNKPGCNTINQVQKSCASSRNMFDILASNLTEKDKSIPLNTVSLEAKKETFTIFPNPSKGNCFIQLNAESKAQTISIRDIKGVLLKEISIGPAQQNIAVPIDLNGHPPGLYFVQLKSALGIQSKKVVLE